MVKDTSAIPRGLRPSVPLKITSAISPPRRALADCSPSTQRIASDTFDLPHPLGPTIAVTPGWKFSAVLSAKDLNPRTVRFFKYMILAKITQLLVPRKGEKHHIQGTPSSGAQQIGEEPRFGLCYQPPLPLTISISCGILPDGTAGFQALFQKILWLKLRLLSLPCRFGTELVGDSGVAQGLSTDQRRCLSFD